MWVLDIAFSSYDCYIRMFLFFNQVTLIAAAWKFHALQKVDDPADPQTTPRRGTVPRPSLRALGLTS